MTPLADLIEQMAADGAPLAAIVRAVRAIEERDAAAADVRAKAAERKRKQRERDKDGTVTGQSRDCRGTSPQSPPNPPTPPNTPPISPRSDEANASSGGAAADPVKAVFDLGVSLLTAAGSKPMAARSIVGKWRRDYGDGEVFSALTEARARGVTQPVEWVEKRLSRRARPEAHHSEMAVPC